jgi:hypothetical protein
MGEKVPPAEFGDEYLNPHHTGALISNILSK